MSVGNKPKVGFTLDKPHELGFGTCASCGHGQRVTLLEMELPAAPRCIKCGGPIQVNVFTPAKQEPKPWRCPGCGGKYDPKNLHWSIPLHLSNSPDCAAVLFQKDRFVRHGMTFILPETAHLKKKEKKWYLLASQCEGVLVTLGEWVLGDKQYAKEMLRQIYPSAPQLSP